MENFDTSGLSKSTKRNRRGKLIIFPQFQLLLIVANLGINFVVAILTWLQTRRAFANLEPAAGLSGMEVSFYKKYLAYHMGVYQTSVFWTLGIGLVAVGLLTLFVSHRFAGPIVRLRNYFTEIGERGWPKYPLGFRDGDYLHDLPPIINHAIETLRETPAAEPKKKAK